MIDTQAVLDVAANPTPARLELEYELSEASLIDFMRYGWHTLEPGRQFKDGWVNHAICDHLEAVTNGDLRFVILNVPPGSTKSMTTSVFWHAWEWGPKGLPHNRFIKTSYAQGLSIRDNMRARDLMKSDWYANKWPIHWKADKDGKTEYENDQTGWSLAASSGSQLTGFRGDRIIVDDPHSVQSADSDQKRENVLFWFTETLPSRFNDMNESALVIIMQRLHERDVSGIAIAKELGYEVLMIPMEYEPLRSCYSVLKPSYIDKPKKELTYYNPKEMCWQTQDMAKGWMIKQAPEGSEPITDEDVENNIATWKNQERYKVDPRTEDGELMHPDRFNQEAVTRLKETLSSLGGDYAIAGQLQQRPVPRGGGMFKREDFRFLDHVPNGYIYWVRGWDLAASDTKRSPRTAGVRMGVDSQGRYIIGDVVAGRWNPGDAESNILRTVQDDGNGIKQSLPQDPGQAGKSQKSALGKLLAGFDFTFSPESGTKEDRARPLAAQVENGNVFLVRGPWNETFLDEITKFPNGAFKDQTDAATRAFMELVKKKSTKDYSAAMQPIVL